MSALVIPNNLADGQPAAAAPLMANLNAIESWVNSNVLRRDGTVAMLAPLTLSGAPVSDNHAARKKYVDDMVWDTASIANDAVKTAKIEDGAVTAAKLLQEVGSQAVTTDTIRANAVTQAKMAAGAVGTNQIINGAVTSEKILANAVTHVERLRGARFEAINTGTNQTVTSGSDDRVKMGNTILDTFVGGMVVSDADRIFRVPAGYEGDYSIVFRLTLSGDSPDPTSLFGSNVIINNGTRDYRLPFANGFKTDLTWSAIVALNSSTGCTVSIGNGTAATFTITAARIEIRQLS